MHLTFYTNQGEQALHCLVTGYEIYVNNVTPESKKALIMWKHPCFPQAKKFKAIPPARKIMAAVFWDYKGVRLVDMVHCHQ
jgi:hypothetical protein